MRRRRAYAVAGRARLDAATGRVAGWQRRGGSAQGATGMRAAPQPAGEGTNAAEGERFKSGAGTVMGLAAARMARGRGRGGRRVTPRPRRRYPRS